MQVSNIAVAFPGQGAQKVGMADRSVGGDGEVFFSQASAILGYDLLDLCMNGPDNRLGQSRYAQPALLVTGISVWSQLKAKIKPQVFAGHSLGEITALVAAEAISFADGVRLVLKRGELMEACSSDGGMVAILGLESDQVAEICRNASESGWVQPANYNAPGQIVISGKTAGLERASELAKDAGARRVVPLNVSGPFHSKLMEPAAIEYSQFLVEIPFQDPVVPVVSNAKNELITKGSELREELTSQLTNPVRWIENVGFMESLGITELVEIGDAPVLIGMTKRISRKMKLTLA